MDNMSGMDMASSMSSMAAAMETMSMSMASMMSMSMSMPPAHDHSAMATPTASMDMGSMSMGSMATMASMASMSMAPAATASSGHHGMSGMGMGNGCKISMLWNWNTIDACFISTGWHITTRGMFAGTCIGVFFWVIAICLVQRLHREFDRFIYRQWQEKNGIVGCSQATEGSKDSTSSPSRSKFAMFVEEIGPTRTTFRPNIWQQFVRACLFTLEFGAGYLLMLMAMYYNGYVLITMWLGALFGYFFLGSDTAGGNPGTPQKATCC